MTVAKSGLWSLAVILTLTSPVVAQSEPPRLPGFLKAIFAPKPQAADAVTPDGVTKIEPVSARAAPSNARAAVKAGVAYATQNRPKGRLWCVPFARTVSGVSIRGNAKTWWASAKGQYARGHDPRIGAVMAFAASRAMPMGHVAVVSQVISDREILVDHANWDRNRITTDQRVVDVSPKGDWSQVRVAHSKTGVLGRVNPVNGFIYN